MLRLADDSLFADQPGDPTRVSYITHGTLAAARNPRDGRDPAHCGPFHMSGAHGVTLAEFAVAILDVSRETGRPSAREMHIAISDNTTKARRAANSRLDTNKLGSTHCVRLPAWRRSLKNVVTRLLEQDA